MLATKKLRGNMQTIIPMIPLHQMTPDTIADHLPSVPKYGPTDFQSLVENTIGAIHQVPRIFHKETRIEYQLKQVEAYFGRSSAGGGHVASNLYNCWARGRDERSHTYGMVFARTTIKASLRYERHGILLISALKEEDGLCISNRTLTAKGGVGSNEPGFLYMTFRLLKNEPEPGRELTYDEIRGCVRRMKDELIDLASEMKVSSKDVEVAFQAGLNQANDINDFGQHKVKRIDYSNE